MSVAFSCNHFPPNVDFKKKCGLPWGAIIQPFAELPNDFIQENDLPMDTIGRCKGCKAYINSYCTFGRTKWTCSICGANNPLSDRYSKSRTLEHLPELKSNVYEVVMGEMEVNLEDAFSTVHPGDNPVYIFVVDLSQEGPIELMKASIMAALEALPDNAWVGLCVFANKVGMYDLRSNVPHIRYLRIPKEQEIESSSELYPGFLLSDLAPLNQNIAKLAECKDEAWSAVDSLTSLSCDHTSEAKRGFGSSLAALYNMVSETELNCRLVTFLGGMPNYGLGALDGKRFKESSPASLLHPQTLFYRHLAHELARSGICVDLYILSDLTYCDVATLKYLPLLTGGSLVLYAANEEASVPQEVFRQLKTPHCFRGLLRMRTSTEYEVAAVYGHLVPDDQHDLLFHLAGCDSRMTVAVDFNFVSGGGFGGYYDVKPVLQTAFAYTAMEPKKYEDRDGKIRNILIPVRRLRIHTVENEVARTYKQLYKGVNPEVIVALLTQQVIHRSLDLGPEEAHELLKDWLVQLLASFNTNLLTGAKEEEKQLQWEDIDTGFSGCTNLAFMPRFIFGILKNPMLSLDDVHPDVRVFLHCMYSSLEPNYLVKALYPTLTSFQDPDTLVHRVLYLAESSLTPENGSIFLLDTLTTLCIYYSPRAIASNTPFPPDHHSQIRTMVATIKANAPVVTPRLLMVQDGEGNCKDFFQGLIEEKEVMDYSYEEFFEHVCAKLADVLGVERSPEPSIAIVEENVQM